MNPTGTPQTGSGLRLPGYQLGEVIGRGGFATVYQAEQLSLGRQVAVKVLMADLATETHRRRFDREREILVRLSAHPNVVDVHDAGLTPEHRPFIVMRLYRAGSLASRLESHGPMPVAEAVPLIARVAAALDAAHAMGVLHRDVKPENVLLSDTGEPALSDFGISALTERPGTRTSTTFFTLAHAAPEVLNGKPFSVASDVYALASTTYHLLAGRPAFEGVGLAAMRRIVTAEAPPIGRQDVPAALEAVLRRGMAKEPAHRYRTPGDFAADLGNALAPPPGWSPPPPPPLPPAPVMGPPPAMPPAGGPLAGGGVAAPGPVPGTRAPLTRRPAVLAGALAGVLVLGVGAYALAQGGGSPENHPVANSSTPAGASATASDSPGPGASGDPSGSSSTEASGGADGKDTDLSPIPATKTIMSKDYISAIAVDPRTGRIATAMGLKGVVVWDPATGSQVQRLATESLGLTQGIVYRADGAVLYGSGMGMRAWTTKTPGAPRVFTDKRDVHTWREVLSNPDGSRLVTAERRKISPLLSFWDTSRGAHLSNLSMPDNVQDIAVTPDGRYVLVMMAGQVSVLDMGGTKWTGHPVSTRAITLQEPFNTTDDVGMAVSPDGRTLATSTPEAPIQLWDLATGRPTTTLESGWVTDHAWGMAFSPDGKRLISRTFHSVEVWDLAQGVVQWELDIGKDSTQQVSFGADSSTAVVLSTGNGDTARSRSWLRVWQLR